MHVHSLVNPYMFHVVQVCAYRDTCCGHIGLSFLLFIDLICGICRRLCGCVSVWVSHLYTYIYNYYLRMYDGYIYIYIYCICCIYTVCVGVCACVRSSCQSCLSCLSRLCRPLDLSSLSLSLAGWLAGWLAGCVAVLRCLSLSLFAVLRGLDWGQTP